VITTENTVQAIVRQDEKGRDAAKAALEMSLLLGSRL
jgi:6,7-dimethyl-8-ribityllumazine synthase